MKKLIILSVPLAFFLFASPSFAEESSTPVDQLEDEIAKISDTYDVVVPVAVGSAVFGVGMILIKRIAYS